DRPLQAAGAGGLHGADDALVLREHLRPGAAAPDETGRRRCAGPACAGVPGDRHPGPASSGIIPPHRLRFRARSPPIHSEQLRAAPRPCRLLTRGCKVNQYETQYAKELLEANGYRAAAPDEPADLCLVNTCTVTHEADAKGRQLIRRLAQTN